MAESFDRQLARDALTHLLRHGLIEIRLRASAPRRGRRLQAELEEWAELCHGIPAILLSDCDERALRWFVERHGAEFVRRYPSRDNGAFAAVQALLGELAALLPHERE